MKRRKAEKVSSLSLPGMISVNRTKCEKLSELLLSIARIYYTNAGSSHRKQDILQSFRTNLMNKNLLDNKLNNNFIT